MDLTHALICDICEEQKTLEQFYRRGRYYRNECKSCGEIDRTKRENKSRVFWQGKDPYELHLTGRKVCTRCEKEKKVTRFYINRSLKDGLTAECKQCNKKRRALRIYGFHVTALDECEICSSRKRLVIDHDHNSGNIRGILCNMCNTMIGYAHEDTHVLIAAIEYILRYQNK